MTSLDRDPSRGGDGPLAPVNRLVKHETIQGRSPVTSYSGAPGRSKTPVRKVYPNLSPTRAPADPSDLALWPCWTRVPIERLGFTLLSEDGTPVGVGGA